MISRCLIPALSLALYGTGRLTATTCSTFRTPATTRTSPGTAAAICGSSRSPAPADSSIGEHLVSRKDGDMTGGANEDGTFQCSLNRDGDRAGSGVAEQSRSGETARDGREHHVQPDAYQKFLWAGRGSPNTNRTAEINMFVADALVTVNRKHFVKGLQIAKLPSGRH